MILSAQRTINKSVNVVEVLTNALAAPVSRSDAAINLILSEMGSFAKVDRAYVFQRKPGDLLDNTHEWCSKGIDPMIEHLQDLSMEMIAPWREDFESGRIFHAPSINDLDLKPSIREFLNAQGIKGILLVPLRTDGKIIGFAGYDTVKRTRHFSQEEIRILSAMAGAIGTILARSIVDKEIQESRAVLEYFAMHDHLTGAPNRRAFQLALEESVTACSGGCGESSVGIVDLIKFKSVNETYGHGAGDHILQSIVRRWHFLTELSVSLFRIGGDEFGLIYRGENSIENLKDAILMMRSTLKQPFFYRGHSVRIDMGAGIAVVDSGLTTASEVFANADLALFSSKSLKGKPCVYDKELRRRATDRYQIAQEMLATNADEDFILEFQPIVEIKTGDVVGAEALLRWKHKSRGLVKPKDFIDVLCSLEHSLHVGRWILNSACREIASLNQKLQRSIFVSVNVFPLQISSTVFAEEVLGALSQSGLAPGLLEIEVTENIAMEEDGSCREALRKLWDIGVSVSLDDFGTGYATLSSLTQLKVQTVKVDRSFVSDLSEADPRTSVLKAVKDLTESLGIRAVVEGIENSSVAELVRRVGFQFGQGYFWSKPLDIELLARLIEDRTSSE